MSLTTLWNTSPDQLQEKTVQQVIAFAGNGRLLDNSVASSEFREFLGSVPSELLALYADQCLNQKFDDNGLALQDIINEIGRRLGFAVVDGRYRGTASAVGHDGLWTSSEAHSIIVEVKTTDTYSINLETVAEYRRKLIEHGDVAGHSSSMLIIVGRQDTGNLEAQIRGSRFAWDLRLISVDALLRLLRVREDVEGPEIAKKISEILIPYEYTRVDRIIDIVFSAAEDVLSLDSVDDDEIRGMNGADATARKPKLVPVKFHDACAQRVEQYLNRKLLKRSRATFASADKSLAVICLVSKEHDSSGTPNYWFAFHPHQRDFLSNASEAYVTFGCASADLVVAVPFHLFASWTAGMHTTTTDDGKFYWHVQIFEENRRFVLHRRKDEERIDVTPFLLPPASETTLIEGSNF
jgi:hypothetical protein